MRRHCKKIFIFSDKDHPITGHEGPDREHEVYLYTFFNLGARWGQVVNAMSWPLYLQERRPISTVQDNGCAPRPV
jgi:hypothetical protein